MLDYLQTLPPSYEPLQCVVCRQFRLDEIDWLDLGAMFGFDDQDDQCVDELSTEAQEYVRQFQRGQITRPQLRADTQRKRRRLREAAENRRPHRPLLED